MFKRRVSPTLSRQIREALWPSMGWKRLSRYAYLRLMRSSETSHKIAGGLAIGTSVAFTPIIGTHFIQAALLSWLFRCNIILAIAATWIANPWTIPLIWWGSIELGARIFGLFGIRADKPFPKHMDFQTFWHLLVHDPVQVLLPWLTGGYMLAALVFMPAYVLCYHLIRSMRSQELKKHDQEIHHTVSAQ